MRRKIAVFTGNRAEYGLLLPIIQLIHQHSALELQLFVAGAHLDPAYGRTVDQIKAAGFPIAAEIKIDLADDNLFGTAMAIGQGIQFMAEALQQHQPDLLVVYADRFEGFAAVIAASQMRIAVAHVEGGDVTEGGALDDSVRHAMTKLSHLHFTTHQAAADNVQQMGEEAWRIFNVGLPSIDGIVQGKLASAVDIQQRFSLDVTRPLLLFTQHSVTTQFDQTEHQIKASLQALRHFLAQGVQVITTYPNNDAGGALIIAQLQQFREQLSPALRALLWLEPSLGSFLYHGILALAKDPLRQIVCVGNSSSGIKETPIFGCPTVNIGSRQDGRLRAGNVLDCGNEPTAIIKAIDQCLTDPVFRKQCQQVENPYGTGQAAVQMVEVLANIEIDQRLIAKKTIFFS